MSKGNALSFSTVEAFLPEARRLEVVPEARAPRGFVEHLRAGKVSRQWQARRKQEIKRHLGHLKGKPLYDSEGRPSHHHLALIVWAYSPDASTIRQQAKILKGGTRQNPSRRRNPWVKESGKWLSMTPPQFELRKALNQETGRHWQIEHPIIIPPDIREHGRLAGKDDAGRWVLPGCYWADLALPSLQLVVEVDGTSHDRPKDQAKDRKRDQAFAALGWIVLRVTNDLGNTRPVETAREIVKTIERIEARGK